MIAAGTDPPGVATRVIEKAARRSPVSEFRHAMHQEPTNPPTPLEYATPTLAIPPRRYWVFAGFAVALVVLEGLQPRMRPPGWPTTFDYLLMLLLPIGAIVMALATSLPGCLLGLYGLFGSMIFLQAQFTDTRLQFRLGTPSDVRSFLVFWSAFVVASWAVCRGAVLLRRLQAAA